MENLAADTCHFISFCRLTPETQAAWVQAVFSIIGIGVAILVPWHLRHAEQKDRKLKEIDASRDLALLLLPAVQHWRRQLSIPADPGERAYRAVFDELYKVPSEVASDIERLHLLGPAARHLQAAVFLAREIEANDQVVKGHLRGDHPIPVDRTPNWEAELDRLSENLDNAERAMRALF